MGETRQSRGTCGYCGLSVAKSHMVRHLASCAARWAGIESSSQKQGRVTTLCHLRVQDEGEGAFWLDLEMPASGSLDSLDSYLRHIWLECCGHPSRFVGGGRWQKELGGQQRLGELLQDKGELTHIYDPASPSVTSIHVVGTRAGKATTSHPIALMARNQMPPVKCIVCGEAATWWCLRCLHQGQRWGLFCIGHAPAHPHAEAGDLVPLVNSPRAGLCCYDGPAEPPY